MLPHMASKEIIFEEIYMIINKWSVNLVNIYLFMLTSACIRGQE